MFCASAFIAGIAGSLFGGLQSNVSDITVEPINNIVLFLFAVVGGITTVTGAFLGGALFALLPLIEAEWPDYAGIPFVVVAGVAVALGRQPNGLAGIIYSWFEPLRRSRDDVSDGAPAPPPTAAQPVTSAKEVVGATV